VRAAASKRSTSSKLNHVRTACTVRSLRRHSGMQIVSL
jgi:hypothetical protein